MSRHVDLAALEQIQHRILWLATRIVDHANNERPNHDGLKVGGHQASSASMVSLMTALWFGHLGAHDRVAVKPHASPVLHAIQYLLGNLEREDLTKLRSFGGLQAYPSATKDPFPVDFSTGSVGFGAVAPLFAATTRRYVDAHFGERPRARFVSLLGDAELDEGNVWEAVADPVTSGLGNVLWIVDLNRQSLDRVVPGIKAAKLKEMFEHNDWHVLDVKYGQKLQKAFVEPGGADLRAWIDAMPNEHYQASFAFEGARLREFFFEGAPAAARQAVEAVPDGELGPLLHNLGGHDLPSLLDAYAEADAVIDRPTVVFAYTIKGWGLPFAGDPRNHSALLTDEQLTSVRQRYGITDDWAGVPEGSAAAELVADTTDRLRRNDPGSRSRIEVPSSVGRRSTRPTSTQEAFGRLVTRLGRDEHAGPRLVTTSPDVAVSTNLGGWINTAGIFSPTERESFDDGGALSWREHPGGQHLELGISEMNLFSLLGQLGSSGRLHGERLLPIGTVYDPFVCRGLDALIHSLYNAGRFVIAGTPSGVTLAPEGGAHQSTITASIGLELPGIDLAEPAYAGALDWLLCDGLDRIANDPHGRSLYLRLTTRQIDQTPFVAAVDRLGEDAVRHAVLSGAYVLHEAGAGGEPLTITASGAVMPEVLEAAAELVDEGAHVRVVDITSMDRVYRDWQRCVRTGVRTATCLDDGHHLAAQALPGAPVLSVHDAASHAMAWIGAALGAPQVALGVDEFGQSGTITDLYAAHDLDPGAIVNGGVAALALRARTA